VPAPLASPHPTRHWIVPFASSLSEPCQHALTQLDTAAAPLALPHLRQLLGSLGQVSKLEGDEYALSMPHERVMARALGWLDDAGAARAGPPPGDGSAGGDGTLPWSAWWAAQDGLSLTPGQHWGLLSPGHWLMGRDHLTLLDPLALGLNEAESRALFKAVQDLFESDGWKLLWGAPTRWYVAHPSLAGLPTASLDRLIGRNPDLWLTDHPQARMVRRLQSEVQMLLYQHPINDAREAAGQPTVNSFWLSGCGLPPAQTALPAGTVLIDDLRAPLLADDMPAWLDTWARLDQIVFKAIAEAVATGQPVQLTLCGERHAVTLAPGPAPGLGGKLLQSLKRLTGSASAPKAGAWLRDL
jgi:hypothetical protein